MKRGPKRYEDAMNPDVMPLRVIACRMRLSERTISTAYKSAMEKLNKLPEVRERLQLASWARAIFERDLLHACSAECDKEFVSEYAGHRGGSL
jgi:hypothetical protein